MARVQQLSSSGVMAIQYIFVGCDAMIDAVLATRRLPHGED